MNHDTVYPREFEEIMKHLTLRRNGDIVTPDGKVVGHADLDEDAWKELFDDTPMAISIKGSDDTISRKVLLDRVDEEREYLKARGLYGAEHILVHNFRELVENAPPIKPVVDDMTQDIINKMKVNIGCATPYDPDKGE